MNGFLDYQTEENMALFTDLYELTMGASYFDNQKFEPATFDLFIRRLPPNRSYFLFAGLDQVLLYLESIKFNEPQLTYLSALGFKEPFLDYLRGFRFTGDVCAVPEGTVVFPNEPIIRVTAPIIEAQIIETFLLNTVNLQTMIATKASRVVYASGGKSVIEFGLRREQGVDAGIKVARSSYIAGCDGTSNVLAGMAYGIPVFGTMAHSYVMSFEREIDAFRAFAKTFPQNSTLLIDTYDDLKGAEKAAIIAKELEQNGFRLGGVRLDSGDLSETSKKIRILLDQKDLPYIKIFASGDLDEFRIQELLASGAQIDAFGVGTKMGTSADAPYTDVIYKLSEVMNSQGEFQPIMKFSRGKVTYPGRKQVCRFYDKEGFYAHDVISLTDEEADGDPLLVKVMENGKICSSMPSLLQIRNTASDNLAKLPAKYKRFSDSPVFPVRLSTALIELMSDLDKKIRSSELL